MTQTACLQGFDVSVAPAPRASSPTPTEREARRLLCLHTSEDTARAEQVLSNVSGEGVRGEWYFLMGICALRRSYLADAQAHLDRARTICPDEPEYHAAYESIQFAARRRNEDGGSSEGGSRGRFCDGVTCLDCGEVLCCDNGCDGCGDGCSCGDGCDCGDCCN